MIYTENIILAKTANRLKGTGGIFMSNVKTTKNMSEATALTHGGVFHADEVMATVILSKIFKDLKVSRTFNVPADFADDVIVYDIGEGKFDHHQKGGNGCRANGVPYASAGLIWKEFGPDICSKTADPKAVWQMVDREIIQGIDAQDNGTLPDLDYPARPLSVSMAIRAFNPTWDYKGDTDEAFLRAVNFAEQIFDNCFAKAAATAKAKILVEEAIRKTTGPVMVLDEYLPWIEFLPHNKEANDILFVVFPSLRGGWNWQCVPGSNGRFSNRKSVPESWRGLRDEAYQKVTGVKTATFCHPGGFIGGAETREAAIELARIAAES